MGYRVRSPDDRRRALDCCDFSQLWGGLLSLGSGEARRWLQGLRTNRLSIHPESGEGSQQSKGGCAAVRGLGVLAGEEDLHAVLHVLVEALLDRLQRGELFRATVEGGFLLDTHLLREGLLHLDQ